MTPDQIRAWRKALDFSQAEAARALDVPVQTLRAWEAGRYPVKHGRVLALACGALARRDSAH